MTMCMILPGSLYNHVDAAFDEEKNGYVARDQLLYAL